MKIINFNITDFNSSKNKKWVLGNNILYKMCSDHPYHNDLEEIRAKIWLIGRSYAAAIERRSKKYKKHINDNFYDYVVEEFIKFNKNYELDRKIMNLKNKEFNKEILKKIILVHEELTQFFKELTGEEKRSLASKYLHFHVPSLFPIYDSRAKNALKKIVIDKFNEGDIIGDKEYAKFCYKILALYNSIKEQNGTSPTMREIDTYLITIANKNLNNELGE